MNKIINYGTGAILFGTMFAVTATLASADALYRELQLGMSGTDVGTLQAFLAKDITIYPQGKVTDYFGFLTKSAVSNFQAKNGLPAVGRVGPATLPVINAQMNGTTISNNFSAPSISNINLSTSNNSVNISWYTNESAKGVIYYSNQPLSTYENDNSVNISGSTVQTSNYSTSQSLSIPNLQSGTTYYYTIYVTDNDGNVSMTWPATFRIN